MPATLRAAVGFAIGILIEARLGGSAWVWAGAVVVVIAAAAAARARRDATAWMIAALLAGAADAARERAAWIARGTPPPHEALEGSIVRAPQAGEHGWQTIVDARRPDGATTWRLRLGLARDRIGADVRPGDHVAFTARVGPVDQWQNPGTPDVGRARRGQGLDGLGTVDAPGLEAITRGGWSIARAAAAVQRVIAARLARAPGRGAALVAALAAGTRAGLPARVEDAFRRAGVSHVLSVSGLHLACVALAAAALAGVVWRRWPWLAVRMTLARASALAALPAAAAYTIVTGAEIATVRALVMAVVILGARALGRAADAAAALGVATIVILAHRPSALYDPSLELSLASSAALIATARAWAARHRPIDATPPGRAARTVRAVGLALLASLAVTAATAPLTAWHFGVVQPAGVVLNLIVPPVLELAVLPLGLAAGLVGIVWSSAGDALATIAAWIAAQTIAFVAWIAPACPVLAVPPPHPWELALLGALALAATRWRARVVVVCALLAAIAIAAGEWRAARDADARTGAAVTFLDVGQGDAALIEAPGGTVWLVDAGGVLFGGATPATDPGARALLPVLAAKRIHAIDLAIVSHPHPDHVGGLAALAAAVPIRTVWITGDSPDEPHWAALRDALAARGTRLEIPPLGVARHAGAATLEVLAPRGADGHATADPLTEVNDNSLVVALAVAGRRVLFLGDLEAAGERALVDAGVDLTADVVKVAHHGSRTSSTDALIAATHARHAVLSLGARNRFGFPAPAVVARWEAAGVTLHRTDRGAITVDLRDDGTLAISPATDLR